MKSLPQEIEVWYLIPALRRELAKILISDFGMSQKKVSETLGITESAVSQYLKSKRGSELRFSEKEREIIKDSAANIIEGKDANEELYKLSLKLRGNEAMCNLHKKLDHSVKKDCELCMSFQ